MQDAAFGGARFTLENDSKLAYENHFHEMALAAVEFASCREIVDDILVKLELKGFVWNRHHFVVTERNRGTSFRICTVTHSQLFHHILPTKFHWM